MSPWPTDAPPVALDSVVLGSLFSWAYTCLHMIVALDTIIRFSSDAQAALGGGMREGGLEIMK